MAKDYVVKYKNDKGKEVTKRVTLEELKKIPQENLLYAEKATKEGIQRAIDYKSKPDQTPDPTPEPEPESEPEPETKDVPDRLESNDDFNSLGDDEKEYILEYVGVLEEQDEQNQQILADALTEAEASANPYFAEKIRMAKEELTRALGKQSDDFASQKTTLESKIEQINEDLAVSKDRLTIDEQSELAKQKKNYEYQLEGLVENASKAGLTFSSKRALAENRLSEEQSDLTESTQRIFQRQIEDLQKAAGRGDTEARNLLTDYERMYGENVTTLIRGTEQQVGTENLPALPALPGVSPLGGVTGNLAEQKQADILQRAEALSNLKNPF